MNTLIVILLLCGATTISSEEGIEGLFEAVDPGDPSSLAEAAYIYYYPIVENLKVLFYTGVWPHTRSYIGINRFNHVTYLLDHTFTAIVSPNCDTLYSQAWLDLDQGAIILSLPYVPNQRYYSMQIVDGFTNNIKTISPRTTGSWDADSYLIVGPNCKPSNTRGFAPDHIIESETRFVFVLGRTGVNGPADMENVFEIQNQYHVHPFGGHFCEGVSLPKFPFVDPNVVRNPNPEPELYFTYVNFIMTYLNIDLSGWEGEYVDYYTLINIGPGLNFDGLNMPSETYHDIQAGIDTGSKRIDNAPGKENFGNSQNGWVATVDPPIFGTPEVMKGQYLKRAYAARIGLYGNDPAEAFYPIGRVDSDGDHLDSAKHNYVLRFNPGELPLLKTGGFWSVTMYRLPEKLFVHSPIDRYSIGSITQGLVYDTDGSVTLYIQKDQPASGTSNWLPAPKVGDATYGNYKSGSFYVMMRIYWPAAQTLDPPYFPPALQKSGTPVN